MLRAQKVIAGRELPGNVMNFSADAGIGFLSCLVVVGGGILSLRCMTHGYVFVNNDVTALAVFGFFNYVANSLGYIYSGFSVIQNQSGMLGYSYWPALIVVSGLSVFTAPMGARFAHRLPVQTLRRVFACLLMGLAVYMLFKAWQQY